MANPKKGMSVSYRQAEASSEEMQQRLDNAFNLLFEEVFKQLGKFDNLKPQI